MQQGAVIDISPAMKMKYTQVIADDLNYNDGTQLSFQQPFQMIGSSGCQNLVHQEWRERS